MSMSPLNKAMRALRGGGRVKRQGRGMRGRERRQELKQEAECDERSWGRAGGRNELRQGGKGQTQRTGVDSDRKRGRGGRSEQTRRQRRGQTGSSRRVTEAGSRKQWRELEAGGLEVFVCCVCF